MVGFVALLEVGEEGATAADVFKKVLGGLKCYPWIL